MVPDGPQTTALDGFCRELVRIVEAESGGFASIRAAALDEATWRGSIVPEGFRQCRIEGDYHPGAIYVCSGSLAPAGVLKADFDNVAARIGQCLQRPSWYPRNWSQGRTFRFAGAERQVMWRDVAQRLAPVVFLKIEEDFARGRYYVRLSVETFR